MLKPLDRHLKQLSAIAAGTASTGEGEALSGRIKYRGEDRSEVEVLFGEKDQVNCRFTKLPPPFKKKVGTRYQNLR